MQATFLYLIEAPQFFYMYKVLHGTATIVYYQCV